MATAKHHALMMMRALGRWVLWLGVLVSVAFAANVLGIRLLGGVDAWAMWLKAHAWYFFAWRLLLYGAITVGWCRIHKNASEQGRSKHDVMRLRLAAAGVLAVMIVAEATGTGFAP
ncbi:hypothetical protein [Xanthomonas oryzae]|uniref:hypothetical protein n=1 Tax=Xanthomonas oryzae TaxID=347 RepID=UPI000B40DA48|nr:hypothetical protein [Xanthomonas oryzae]OWB31486.1 hypothetical protein XocBAI20_06780 [Xanthomonas oryzae pv. oryzicola]